MHWQIPRMWDGGDCWIIGGGTSMPRQFGVPEEIIQQVKNHTLPISAYSAFLTPLHNKNVVGVNLAFLLGDWVSALYFCDAQIFRGFRSEIHKFKNLKLTCANHIDRNLWHEAINLKRLKRDMRLGLSSKSDMICWNHHSGAAAINFAALTGVKRIYLLGFDMKPDESGQTHWHNGKLFYKKPTGPGVFKRFMKGFPHIARDAKYKGVEIINVSPDSAIPDFKKVSLSQVL